MMSLKQRIYAPEHEVLHNDDLLFQILIRLPLLSIHLFTTVSKQWLRILISPHFIQNYSQIRKIDPSAGLFINHPSNSCTFDFLSLDTRSTSIKYTIDKPFKLGWTEAAGIVNILQSCNGLLLCTGWGDNRFYYVYNPSTNHVKLIPEPDYSKDESLFYGYAGFRLAFDPTKTPYYKLVHAGTNAFEIFIEIYSSETGKWSQYRDRFPYFSFVYFDSAIYWNNALHWLETENRKPMHYKLYIEDHEHPTISTIQIPHNHDQPILTNMLPMVISIRIPHMLHQEGKLFESRGGLFLVYRDFIGSTSFTIYEMRKRRDVWSVKHVVSTIDFMSPLPDEWSIRSIVWSFVSGEREEESVLVINSYVKVLQYNLKYKTVREIYDLGSTEVSDDYHHGFIPPCAVFNVGFKKLDYKVFDFIPSFAAV